MNRIDELFERKKSGILNVYCTAGYPFADSTMDVMTALQESGADMIELGMPYSDPLADGPVIQASSARALDNGMTIGKLFADLEGFRASIHLPVILMGYMNPALQYGFESFCKRAAAVGIDGLIIPDLPMHEFETEYAQVIRDSGLKFIFLVTPETSPERISMLDRLSSGFLYAVSSSSTTGSNKSMDQQTSYFEKLDAMHLANPVLVGFGIKDKQTFDTACRHARGAIIGTAYIKALEKAGPLPQTGTDQENVPGIRAITKEFIDGILR